MSPSPTLIDLLYDRITGTFRLLRFHVMVARGLVKLVEKYDRKYRRWRRNPFKPMRQLIGQFAFMRHIASWDDFYKVVDEQAAIIAREARKAEKKRLKIAAYRAKYGA